MRGPRYPGVLTGRGAHRMEVRGNIMGGDVAVRAVWIVQHLAEPVGRAGHDCASFPTREIDYRDLEATCGVFERYPQLIARIVKQGIGVRRECSCGCEQRARRPRGRAAFRDESEVDVFLTRRFQTRSVVSR